MMTRLLLAAVMFAVAQGSAHAAHPLDQVLKAAEESYRILDKNVRDYTCLFWKREQVNGKLNELERLYCKIRHAVPADRVGFGVYAYYLAPEKIKGRQVIYVDGENNGKMLAREGRGIRGLVGVVALDPRGRMAMSSSRYPVTDIGIKNLCKKIVDTVRKEKVHEGTTVRRLEGGHVAGRECVCFEIKHPTRQPHFLAYLARIYFDKELNIPIRYEAYDWPKSGQRPALIEEYTYTKVKFNVGTTPMDFSRERLKK